MIDFTFLLRPYARWRRQVLDHLDPAEAQQQELLSLVHHAAGTRFGQAHDFARIRSVADFQARVPIRRYEDFWEDYWKPAFPEVRDQTWPGLIPWYAATSGTTSGTTKYIPLTDAMLRSNRRAAIDILVHHLANHPESRPLGGKTFLLGGTTDVTPEAPGVASGYLSGVAIRTQSRWMRPFAFPPPDMAAIDNWDRKLETFARAGLKQNIAILSGTPSWLLVLLDRMAELNDGRPAWPDLQMLVHGGVAFDIYRDRFRPHLEGTAARTREVYPASEGFMAIADRGDGDGMRLCLDNGIFFEFIPLEDLNSDTPARHWAATIETGVDYAIVLSSNSGMFAYLIGDTVRFVDRRPPRLLITGRTSYMLSAFGEHLIGDEIDRAVNRAASEAGLTLHEFTVGPVLPAGPGAVGNHLFLIEPEGEATADPSLLGQAIDGYLSELNDDYRAHRHDGTGMGPPDIRLVPRGSFDGWMRSKGKLGGQHKVPRVLSNPEKFRTFLNEINSL